MQKVLYPLLKAALAQPLHTSVDALEEAHENLFYLETAEYELFLDAAPALETWLAAVVAGKRQQLQQQRGCYAMQFYCWHDAQALQLRFSLVAAAAPLPFGCPVRLVGLPVVVRTFLTQEHLVFDENLFESTLPAGQLIAAQTATEAFVLPVWRIVIS
jgi:cytochrome c1